MVHFLLRFNFGSSDFCYVDLGLNWQPLYYANGHMNPDYPLGPGREFGQIFSLSDMKILRVCMCTLPDAMKLVEDFGLVDPDANELVDPTDRVTNDQVDYMDDDITVLSTERYGETRILTNKDMVLITEDEG